MDYCPRSRYCGPSSVPNLAGANYHLEQTSRVATGVSIKGWRPLKSGNKAVRTF